jgi:hypothetical protein
MFHDAMAGIATARGSRRRPEYARGLPGSDLRGKIGVTDGCPSGYRQKRPPHALLERCAAHVQRQIEADRRRLDEPDDPGHDVFKRDRLRSASREESDPRIAHESVRIVSEQDRADTLRALGDQNGTEEHSPTANRMSVWSRPRDSRSASCPASSDVA